MKIFLLIIIFYMIFDKYLLIHKKCESFIIWD